MYNEAQDIYKKAIEELGQDAEGSSIGATLLFNVSMCAMQLGDREE